MLNESPFTIRNFEAEDESLLVNFLNSLRVEYPDFNIDPFLEQIANYFNSVLDKGGQIIIASDFDEFAGCAGFTEENDETAEIIGWFLMPNQTENKELFEEMAAVLIDEMQYRKYTQINCPSTAYCQNITQLLKWEGFRPNSVNASLLEKKW